ncbi:MAG: aspartate--tRNA ligase, partial [Desulfobacterales bacterium]|nr:aspartate--tRNA ligase [Desulfobacterales bacterium]
MADILGTMRRTHHCAQLGVKDEGAEIILMGWVQRRRDHGGVIFIDLRDREGITQVVFNPEKEKEAHAKAHQLRSEYVIGIKGIVELRPEGMANPELKTGQIEVIVSELAILNISATPPFLVEDHIDVSENIRLTHRHIDLRRPQLQKNLIIRHKAAQAVRTYLNNIGFLDIETPFLTKSTPEGARDYLVPSRVNQGLFYALPQSPQLFKQLLMVSGFDKYYQIVRCFRDEDLRADRQPEFTQIDLEMSFVGEEDVMNVAEGIICEVFDAVHNMKLSRPFPQLTYDEAMDRFGLDCPDTRFGLELKELTDLAQQSEFQLFRDEISKGGIVKALNAKGCIDFSRKE